MNIRPLFDNVVIEPLESTQETVSGIVLPDNAKEKPQMGEVIAVGPGRQEESRVLSTDVGGGMAISRTPMFVKIGQKVMYKKWGGNEVKANGKEYIIVEQKDILAVLE